ncbi:endonuclease/exonuclease/phosphatase family protein [Arthrobacter tumbae]|uniref:endonuclease/exonuclease/phosphatase family protein n=1 Tax=Arthrobacter tumbae TaxID=163874 RepID=UPI00195D2CE2|nr:endonuclease/exonuclease/phosphatase family protein [Arthrobacter tumbae]MBM7781526.1 endonuclease/exonuclease/phosphatase family metal-dependent hydrolase [Arthrobacter tumbae]
MYSARVPRRRAAAILVTLAVAAAGVAVPSTATAAHKPNVAQQGQGKQELRFATYNASLNRSAEGALVEDLSTGHDEQAGRIAEVIQINNPDVVLLNEFDYDPGHEAAELFRTNYLEVGQNGKAPVRYPYVYTAPSNTGVPSGMDLNNDGTVGGPDDALGFGQFEGQYGMVLYSRYPIDTGNVRTFQNFLWADMPGALLPDDPATDRAADWFTEEELAAVRLSSKSHWNVPVTVGSSTVHVLASHPTPPVFDAEEDRNGRRNSDEIRFWADYIHGGGKARYIYDDDGDRGGLDRRADFVVLGDLNSDPADGDSRPGSISQLLGLKQLQDPQPAAEGAAEASVLQGRVNSEHRGDPALDTADFEDADAGNIRVDYVLPSKSLKVRGAGIFWPRAGTPGSELTGIFPFPTSDHRLVYVDVDVKKR